MKLQKNMIKNRWREDIKIVTSHLSFTEVDEKL